jgi:hypothetical protein
MKTVIEMAREAGFEFSGNELTWESVICTEELERFAELVRADERNSRAHSLGYGEMELSLRRNHKDDLFECRRRFSAEEVMHGPDFMVEATASNLEVEMDRAIQARSGEQK